MEQPIDPPTSTDNTILLDGLTRVFRQLEKLEALPAQMEKLSARLEKLETLPAQMEKLSARLEKLETLPAQMEKLSARLEKLETIPAQMEKLSVQMEKLEIRMEKLETRMEKLENSVAKLQKSAKGAADMKVKLDMATLDIIHFQKNYASKTAVDEIKSQLKTNVKACINNSVLRLATYHVSRQLAFYRFPTQFPISRMHDIDTNLPIAGFPTSLAEIETLGTAKAKEILEFLYLPTDGTQSDRQKRIEHHSGLL